MVRGCQVQGFSTDYGKRSATPETRCCAWCECDRVIAVTEANDREVVPERWNAVGADSDMWMDMAQDPRFVTGTEPEGELGTLLEYLGAYRLTMEMKCADLDAAQ